MNRQHRRLVALLVWAFVISPSAVAAQRVVAPEILLRLDDVGMNHSVNQAVEQVAKTGLPFSVSVLFACPWYQEAVEILKKYPHVAVGVHLALNSEWRNYRWGPVLGAGGVPSLVDSNGYFHPSRPAFLASKYDLAEVERELTAQVERAMKSGLKISYVDAHMGMAEATPQLREIEERIARKYGLGISTYFSENYVSMWGVPVASKKSTLLSQIASAKPDALTLFEIHVAERTPEMEVIIDMNAPSQNAPGAGVVDHRKAELEMMLSPELAELSRSGKIKLVTYKDVVARAGLDVMRRPVGGMMAPASQSPPRPTMQASAIRPLSEAKRENFDWGTLYTYYADESHGTRDGLAAVAVIKPGREIHPPHQHAEEEYLMVLEGRGTWHLNGRERPARAGDMQYAAPWDVHGVKNTGRTPLRFVVWKWNSKGVAPLARPR